MFSDNEIKQWKDKGLKISPKIQKNPNAILSPGTKWWVDATDRFAPLMTDEEVEKYYNSPQLFVDDFTKNALLYSDFIKFLIKHIDELQENKISQIISFFHLFQSSMDNHYFKFDRHFEYTESDRSPVGKHWLNLNKRVAELKPELTENERKALLFDLISNKATPEDAQIKKYTNAIKLFAETQEKEIKLVSIDGTQVAVTCMIKLIERLQSLEGADKLKNLFSEEGVKGAVIGTRKLLQHPETYLSEKELKNYLEMIEKWV